MKKPGWKEGNYILVLGWYGGLKRATFLPSLGFSFLDCNIKAAR
jgi:hypothetical protein